MQLPAPIEYDAGELDQVAEQAEVELAILLGIEKSLELAMKWMTRGPGNRHKLSTLRFTAQSFERHLIRTRVLADCGGYLHAVTTGKPHLASEVKALWEAREELQADFERIILQLDYVSPDESTAFGQLCTELERYLEDIKAHGQEEIDLIQHAFSQEEGGSG